MMFGRCRPSRRLSGIEVDAIVFASTRRHGNTDRTAKMRPSMLLVTVVGAFLTGDPTFAEQAGSHITAEQHDIGWVETRIQKYAQALGVIAQLVRQPDADTECRGVCFYPSSTRPISWRCAPKSKCDLHCGVNPPVGGCD
jgi:hypothetical protein